KLNGMGQHRQSAGGADTLKRLPWRQPLLVEIGGRALPDVFVERLLDRTDVTLAMKDRGELRAAEHVALRFVFPLSHRDVDAHLVELRNDPGIAVVAAGDERFG